MLKERIDRNLPEFTRQLLARDSFLILTHRRPDGDTVCSAAALCLALRRKGKKAFLAVNPEITERYREYASDIIAPENYVPETVVTADISSVQQFEKTQKVYLDRLSFVIDHHKNNVLPFSVSSLIDSEAAATGEIIYYLIKEMGIPLESQIAELLYIAISTDTGCFRYANTTAETHLICADCISYRFDLERVNREQFETKSKARFAIEKLVVNTLRYYLDGRVASVYVSREMRILTGATEDDVEEFSSIPRQISGVIVGITVYEQKDGTMKISLRSNGAVDVSLICSVFGGGGHKNASGCTINASLDEVLSMLVDEIEKAISVL